MRWIGGDWWLTYAEAEEVSGYGMATLKHLCSHGLLQYRLWRIGLGPGKRALYRLISFRSLQDYYARQVGLVDRNGKARRTRAVGISLPADYTQVRARAQSGPRKGKGTATSSRASQPDDVVT